MSRIRSRPGVDEHLCLWSWAVHGRQVTGDTLSVLRRWSSHARLPPCSWHLLLPPWLNRQLTVRCLSLESVLVTPEWHRTLLFALQPFRLTNSRIFITGDLQSLKTELFYHLFLKEWSVFFAFSCFYLFSSFTMIFLYKYIFFYPGEDPVKDSKST